MSKENHMKWTCMFDFTLRGTLAVQNSLKINISTSGPKINHQSNYYELAFVTLTIKKLLRTSIIQETPTGK